MKAITKGLLVTVHYDYVFKKLVKPASQQLKEMWFNYSGFDGIPWLNKINFNISSLILDNGLVDISHFPDILEYYKNIKQKVLSKLLYISNDPNSENINENFEYCGIDYGSYDSEYSIYSFLYHEIIIRKPRFPQLIRFVDHLNKYFLVSEINIIHEIIEVRNNLIEDGNGLESDDLDQHFIPIYMYRHFM
jgi:hypothetical protein